MPNTDAELREAVELSLNDREAEAEALLSRIVERNVSEFRSAIREELSDAFRVNDRYGRRLQSLAMITGILAGMVAAGWLVWMLWYFGGFQPSIVPTALLSVTCAALGAAAAWRYAK